MGSFLLANHFSDKKMDLPSQVVQSLRWFESLFLEDTVIELRITPNLEIKTLTAEPENTKPNYLHTEVGSRHVCVDTSLGELKYKKVGDIYTWTDEDDVYHVSDKAPTEGKFELFNYAGEKIFDYFTLDLNTDSLPYDFNQKLTVKLNKLFELYGKLLDKTSLKKVDINLRVYQSKTAFQKIKNQHNMPISNKSDGFYSHRNNQAYLLFKNNERTMSTATHEATHAINRAIIGYTPKWLNEGLAEYSENIQVQGKSATVYPDKNWTHKNIISAKLLPLSTLFSVKNNQWNSSIRRQLYATSWAFIYFMMEHPDRKSILARIIKKEQQNICNTINSDQLEIQLGMPITSLQKQFSSWSKEKVKRQSI